MRREKRRAPPGRNCSPSARVQLACIRIGDQATLVNFAAMAVKLPALGTLKVQDGRAGRTWKRQ